MATEPAEPVSAHPSPAGRPTSLGGPGVEGPEDSSRVGVSALRYPSGQAGPSEISVCSDVHVSPYSLAMGIADTRTHLEASSSSIHPRLRLHLLCGSRLSLLPRRLPPKALQFYCQNVVPKYVLTYIYFRPTSLCFIFVYNCGLTVRNKRMCYVMLPRPFFPTIPTLDHTYSTGRVAKQGSFCIM